MLPTQIAGHLVIERATLPPPPYGGKIKSKTLCQATVLATQIWLKLDSENLNRSLLCTFGWSETQILSGRREPAGPYGFGEAWRVSWGGQARWQMWVYNASPCSDKGSTAGGENSQIVTNEQREVTHSNVDWAVRHTKKIWWHWFAMAVIYKWPSKKSAILTRSRWDLWSGCGFVFTSLGDIGRHQSVTITITARSQQMSPAGFHWSHTF